MWVNKAGGQAFDLAQIWGCLLLVLWHLGTRITRPARSSTSSRSAAPWWVCQDGGAPGDFQGRHHHRFVHARGSQSLHQLPQVRAAMQIRCRDRTGLPSGPGTVGTPPQRAHGTLHCARPRTNPAAAAAGCARPSTTTTACSSMSRPTSSPRRATPPTPARAASRCMG